ncbi:MAG TPA: ABC transporter permease subunit [Coxiellaceae bacterium]|nr:ABC transporter permease subunit [Coxiellaceae bacterium]
MKITGKLLYLNLLYLFLYLPLFVVIIFSFNSASHSLLWHGFSWRWYGQLLDDFDLAVVASHSVLVGVLAASLATGIGTLASVSLASYQFKAKKILTKALFMLIIIPDLVLGISLLLLFRLLEIPAGFWTLLIAHTTFCLPFASITVTSRMNLLNKNLIEAARDLGAHDFRIFRRIIVPLLWPAIVASWLLCFTLSLDDVVISYFVSGPNYEILPLTIFSMVKLGVNPEVNALCSIMLVLSLVIVVLAQRALSKKQ